MDGTSSRSAAAVMVGRGGFWVAGVGVAVSVVGMIALL